MDENTSNMQGNNEDNISDTGNEDDATDTGTDNDASEASKLYYGSWNVTSCVGFAPVSALTPEEIEELLGTVIAYDEDRFVWKGRIYDAPAYQENIETSEDFALSYNNALTFTDLGLTESEATVVTVDCDALGNYFYVKDENTLVISYNGAFFEASRDLNEKEPITTGSGERAQLYEGVYFDNRLFGDSDREDYPSTTYEIVISNVTDSTFDFAVYEITLLTGESVLISSRLTADFSEDGTEAIYSGDDYNLIFVFPDYHGSYPVVTDIEISGSTLFEGNTYVNNSIPGHEFG